MVTLTWPVNRPGPQETYYASSGVYEWPRQDPEEYWYEFAFIGTGRYSSTQVQSDQNPLIQTTVILSLVIGIVLGLYSIFIFKLIFIIYNEDLTKQSQHT